MSDGDLAAELARLAAHERQATVALVVHLAEFDARRLYEGAGFTSLFQYCRTVLHLAEGAAYNRIAAARAVRRWPVIADMLLAGSLSVTTVRLLAPHLTPGNHRDLLAAAAGKGKQETDELLARCFPQPDVRAGVRRIPTPQPSVADTTSAVVPCLPAASPGAQVVVGAATSGDTAATRPAVIRPLAPERYEVRFTASSGAREMLRRAQDLLAHAIPNGDIAQVFERALTVLVADLERRKCAAVTRPHSPRRPATDSPHMPAAVRRAVWARDGGRCAFVAKSSGRRCEATRFIEFHHVRPRGVGGPSTVENIQLRCRAHNGHEVDLFYGAGLRWPARAGGSGPAATRSGTGAVATTPAASGPTPTRP